MYIALKLAKLNQIQTKLSVEGPHLTVHGSVWNLQAIEPCQLRDDKLTFAANY